MSLHSAITSDQLKDRFLWTHPTSQQFWHSTGSMVSRSHFLHNKYCCKNYVWLTFHAQLLSGYETCFMIVIKNIKKCHFASGTIEFVWLPHGFIFFNQNSSMLWWDCSGFFFWRLCHLFMGPRKFYCMIHEGAKDLNLLNIFIK